MLLLKEGETVLAIDTASSNGTFLDGVPIGVAALPDDAMLELGRFNMVRWQVVGQSDRVANLRLVPEREPEAEPESVFNPAPEETPEEEWDWDWRRWRKIAIKDLLLAAIVVVLMILDALWRW